MCLRERVSSGASHALDMIIQVVAGSDGLGTSRCRGESSLRISETLVRHSGFLLTVTVIFIATLFVPCPAPPVQNRRGANSNDEHAINTVVYRSARRTRICFYSVGQSTSIQMPSERASERERANERTRKKDRESQGKERGRGEGEEERKKKEKKTTRRGKTDKG